VVKELQYSLLLPKELKELESLWIPMGWRIFQKQWLLWILFCFNLRIQKWIGVKYLKVNIKNINHKLILTSF
jgi:hypothetical protein